MASSEDSFESDFDFWSQLELVSLSQRPILLQQGLIRPESFDDLGDMQLLQEVPRQAASSDTETMKKQLSLERPATHQDTRTHRRVERSMSIIEGAKHVEATNVTIVVKTAAQVRTTQRELEIAVMQLQEELERSFVTLDEAFDDLNVQLTRKDVELSWTLKMLLAHRNFLEKAEIEPSTARFLKIKRPLVQVPPGPSAGDIARRSTEDLRLQVQSLACINEMYRVDRDAAVGIRNRLKEEREALLKQHEEEIQAVALTVQAEEVESETKKQNMLDE